MTLFQNQWAISPATLVFLALTAPAATAEDLSYDLQVQRELSNSLSEQACDGNEAAYQDLRTLALSEQSPAAMNSLAWLYLAEECSYPNEDVSVAVALQLKSSRAGYPIAINNLANRYMRGDGVPQNQETSLNYFEQAISLGYGTSAIQLAHYYLDGNHLPVDYYRAVGLLRTAQEEFGPADERPSSEAIAELAGALDAADANTVGERPASQDARWLYEHNQASWGYVAGGRLRARVFVEADPDSGQLTFGLERVSNDPMIHFMGASVNLSNGKDQELHFGKCGANNCLQLSARDHATDTTYLTIPIIPEARKATLEAMKAGRDITFRYQTRDSLANNKFARFTLGLSGSRDAIERVERLSAVIASQSASPSVSPSTSVVNPSLESMESPGENSAASSALGQPAVSCYYRTKSSLPAISVEKNMAQQQDRNRQVNAAILEDPRGTIVLAYVWGAIPVELNVGNRWAEKWMTIERRDFYTDVTACLRGDFHFDTIEDLVSGRLDQDNSRSRDKPKHRTAKNWKQRIVRFRE